MKKLVFSALALMVLGGWMALEPAKRYWRNYGKEVFQTAEVKRGAISSVVRATGTVEPMLSVQVGSFVSGPIEALYADFNDTVKKDALLAKIDSRIYEADVARDRAALGTARAEIDRVSALLQQAKNDEQRGLGLRSDNKDYISDSELDQLKFSRMSLEAQLGLATANVEQAQAKLNTSLANLGYTEIRSPVDGFIIDRRVEPGQTVAASFTTPVLFVVVPDMAGEMHIFAKVDEADIGMVRAAQEAQRPVRFTVDAYPGEQFTGKVKQIRNRSSIVETVVTFPVVVTTTNSEKKLLAGMTASLFFETQVRENALRVPNAAISFFPAREQVRPSDRKLLEPTRVPATSESMESQEPMDIEATAKAHLQRRNQRHVWVLGAGGQLKAVEITIGISDEHFTEIAAGELSEGDRVVTGINS